VAHEWRGLGLCAQQGIPLCFFDALDGFVHLGDIIHGKLQPF